MLTAVMALTQQAHYDGSVLPSMLAAGTQTDFVEYARCTNPPSSTSICQLEQLLTREQLFGEAAQYPKVVVS